MEFNEFRRRNKNKCFHKDSEYSRIDRIIYIGNNICNVIIYKFGFDSFGTIINKNATIRGNMNNDLSKILGERISKDEFRAAWWRFTKIIMHV